MQASKGKSLDERIRADPVLQTEFVIYIYYQYNEELTNETVSSSLQAVAEGSEGESPEGSLERAIASSLFRTGEGANLFSREEAVRGIGKMKLDVDASKAEGHDFLNEMVIRDYTLFEPFLLNAYHEFMMKTSSLASIHNYLDAEMEVYRGACFCFPGVRKHADEIFSRVYKESAKGVMEDESVRRIEFLQWFVTQYVVPAVDMVAAEWYFTRLRRHLNRRVFPIFMDVFHQRRSVFIVTGKSKNSVVLEDLLYAENFNAKLADAESLERGSVVECTLIRYASSYRINSVVRVISGEEAKKFMAEVRERRELMSAMHDRFVALNGSEVLLLRNTLDAISRYNEFTARFSEERGLKDASLPRLVNSEAFNSHPEFRAALLCETNNFYLSIYYPLLLDAVEGKMSSSSAAEITDICLSNPAAMPFTSLRRIMASHGARLLRMASSLHPELDGLDSLKALIMRERGHSWDYTPLPLVSGGTLDTVHARS